MGKLSFAQVRAAGLPAAAKVGLLLYRYEPLGDRVVVLAATAQRRQPLTTHRVPDNGWSHNAGCACCFCRDQQEVAHEQEAVRAAAW